jgi:glucose-6-phosphate 1-dehydrogenase
MREQTKIKSSKSALEGQTPTTFIILGVTGELAGRKIIPGLFNLHKEAMLPPKFTIIGFSRRTWSDLTFRAYVEKVIKERTGKQPKPKVNSFLKLCFFQKGYFEDKNCYKQLDVALDAHDTEVGVCTNKLFHLAVPPSMYELIFKHLASSGLTIPCGGKLGWTRVLVEKPFGKDLATAQKLDKMLSKLYKEEQIFRIDHYLAKETLQNILAFRFSNTIFEPLWNKEHIEKVELLLHETDRVTERGTLYDEIGSLRDVGQNHMLQMLTAIAMHDPEELNAKRIRSSRAAILNTLIAPSKNEIKNTVARGQYKGFKQEPGVAPNSKTETYFKLAAKLSAGPWKGVPFIFESGKAMRQECGKIVIHFKERPTCVCDLKKGQHLQNTLTFHIKPRQGITIQFWAKVPGYTMEVEPRELSFDYRKKDGVRARRIGEHAHDAYELLIYDAIRGEQTLFASTEEVQASWRFITPILKNWHSTKLKQYAVGSSKL